MLRHKALLLLLVLATACAGKPQLHYAWDHTASFANAKTWTWYDDPKFQMPGGNSIVDGRFIDQNVRAAVAKELASKGFAKTEGKADIYVSYATSPDGVVSQDKFGSYYWWSYPIVGGTKYQKQGSLTLDVRDAGDKLVWRATKTTIIGTNPEKVKGDINDAVDDLLSKFPPPAGAEAK